MSKKPAKHRVLESEIVKACINYLTHAGVFCYRNNTGAFRGEYKGKTRFVRFGVRGAPDIVAIWQGRYFGVECKAAGGKLSDDQLEFGKALEAAGGVYLVVRSLEDAAILARDIKAIGERK